MRRSGPFMILVLVLILAICQCGTHSTPPTEDERSLDIVDSTGPTDTTITTDSSSTTDTTEVEEPVDSSDTVDPPDTTGSTEPADTTDFTEPTDTTISAVRIEGYLMPLTDGNYWVYNGSCSNPPSGLDGSGSTDSISAKAESADGCDAAYQLVSSRGNSSFPQHVELCDSMIRLNGTEWQPYTPNNYFTYTVPAGTFDSCYAVLATFWFNGQDKVIYAKGIGMIERTQVWYSVHSGDSYHCKSSLIRYRIAAE